MALASPRGRVWSSALFVVPDGFVPGDPLGRPARLFRPRAAGWPGAVHTLADPFLFAHSERLFLFMESQAGNRPGTIVCHSTRDLKSFENVGSVLAAQHHLSYPFVFEWGGETFMIPESAAAGEVGLYRFADFPRGLEKVRVLLRGAYVDSSIVAHEGLLYLFTSSDAGLELFSMRDLLADTPRPHPRNPITRDPALARCGGAPIRAGGRLFRLAQNGAWRYGEGLSACSVSRMSQDDYQESVSSADILGKRRRWSAAGGHHMSLARFAGRTVVATDGQADEPYGLWLAKRPAKWLARRIARMRARA